MKKTTALTLLSCLTVMCLSGCSSVSNTAPVQEAGNFLPDATANLPAAAENQPTPEPLFSIPTEVPAAAAAAVTATPNPEMMAALDAATAEPEITAEPTAEVTEEPIATEVPEPTAVSPYSGYSYAALTDPTFGFLLDYSANWRNLPGKYTACYEEQVAEDDFAARIAVTGKKMPHKPESETVVKQFQAYAEHIYKQYDPATFEFSELEDTTFMGKKGYAITYLAYECDIEIKGYMCCTAVDYTIYVYHFCSSYDDYEAMHPVLTRVRDSVRLAQ